MKIKKYARFIYFELAGFVIGYCLFAFLEIINKTWMNNSWSFSEIFIYFTILIIPIAMIHLKLGKILFDEKTEIDKLTNKMLRCKLRKKYGYDYCAKCEDSYTCANDK